MRPRPALVLVALLAVAGLARADARDHFRAGAPRATAFAPDVAARSADLAPRARSGKVVVRNRSPFTADVYVGVDEASLTFVETVPAGFRLVIRGLPRRATYLLWAEDAEQTGSWGPRAFFLRRKFTWTLLGP